MKWYRKELTDAVALANDAPFDPNGEFDQAALFLLGSATARTTSYTRIASYTGLHHDKCRVLARRARETGLFKGYKLSAGDWCDEETGGIAFILDALTLQGMIERVPAGAE